MNKLFKNDLFWMQRESKGLVPWLNKDSYRTFRLLFGRFYKHPFFHECWEHDGAVGLLDNLFDGRVFGNELFNLFFQALVRAEARFVCRYVPQRSHEERLTGNLVSELDAALFLIKDSFKELAVKRYDAPKEIDFYYHDLSRGGRVEKTTGADLGLIFVIDLPDHPFTVRTLTLQAKKVQSNAQIDLAQYETLCKKAQEGAAYLFYDMNHRTLTSPLVYEANRLSSEAEECKQARNKSFSLGFDDVLNGTPLSIFILSQIVSAQAGKSHRNFDDAFNYFEEISAQNISSFDGRVGVVSVGKPIQLALMLMAG